MKHKIWQVGEVSRLLPQHVMQFVEVEGQDAA
jgi:hypothetical protein